MREFIYRNIKTWGFAFLCGIYKIFVYKCDLNVWMCRAAMASYENHANISKRPMPCIIFFLNTQHPVLHAALPPTAIPAHRIPGSVSNWWSLFFLISTCLQGRFCEQVAMKLVISLMKPDEVLLKHKSPSSCWSVRKVWCLFSMSQKSPKAISCTSRFT